MNQDAEVDAAVAPHAARFRDTNHAAILPSTTSFQSPGAFGPYGQLEQHRGRERCLDPLRYAEHIAVLLTVEEKLAALNKASSIKYRPPGDEVWRK